MQENRDRSISSAIDESLSLLKEIMLKSIMRIFLKDLINFDIRREAIKDFTSTNSSLRDIYNLTKQAHRIKNEVSKLTNEKYKTKEIKLFRSII